MGICRIVSKGDDGGSGFGVVTLASLFPILAVLILSIYHFHAQDYVGQPNYKGTAVISNISESYKESSQNITFGFTQTEYEEYLKSKNLPKDTEKEYTGTTSRLEGGKIIVENVSAIYSKKSKDNIDKNSLKHLNPDTNGLATLKGAVLTAAIAIIPLSLFLFITLRFFLREKVPHADEISIGILFAVVGMAIFVIGIELGLTPLGEQLGSNIPSTFTTISPWGLDGHKMALTSDSVGKIIACVFAFFLGFGATLAEPALNALGATVEKITTGAFKKSLLMNTVASGVGIGIATGVFKIAYNIPLQYLLIPPYIILIFLTIASSEDFVNFGWDSAGVTTGPITVPLVLAMGLGVGANVPGVIDGFGVLSLASVAPIISVLIVGIIVRLKSSSKGKKPKPSNIEGSQS
ncbi:hypothetical protein DID75_01050 [Candidatus Marinamargulisbacteria bacterium SCGC AG-410-N11]|nr:hypothetical protein DID75_01050 [Candidatus Marinamargulisbacteria bacterium SCGC AG-410-N11]